LVTQLNVQLGNGPARHSKFNLAHLQTKKVSWKIPQTENIKNQPYQTLQD
jgi:hypothetical protein